TADARAVLTVQIFQRDSIAIDRDPRMTPGHAVRIEPDLYARIAPHQILAGNQRYLSQGREQPALEGRSCLARNGQFRRVSMEGVAVTLHGPHELCSPSVVADRAADFSHEHR